MPFVTGVRFDHIIAREPAIADFIPDYSTTLQTRINEAKAIIDNKLRAMGYDLEKIGKKDYVWDWDNSAGVEDRVTKTITAPTASQLLLVIASPRNVTAVLTVRGSRGSDHLIVDHVSIVIGPLPTSYILPFVDSEIEIEILSPYLAIDAGSLNVYLTDPAIFMVHIYKALELIYRAMQSDVGDLFQTKADFYREMFEAEFSNIVTAYDLNEDGTTTTQEIQAITSGRRYYR